MRTVLLIAAALAVASAAPAMASTETVRLAVSYCPSAFTGKGGVVSVDPSAGGKFSVINHGWHYPSIDDCPENEDPNVLVDDGAIVLTFPDYWGMTVRVDTAIGNITSTVKPHSATSLAYDGFTAFAVSGSNYVGITPQAAQKGFCDNGCFQYGAQDQETGLFTGAEFIPYKAAMTDVAYLDKASNTFYSQMSYPLTAAAACSSTASDQCMVALDATTGAVKSTKLSNSWEVYSWAPQTLDASGSMLAWVFGFESTCKHPYNDFAFARVNPAANTAELVACIPKDVTVHTDENIASFNSDGSLFATSSGNSETGEVQLLVFNTATGATVLNSPLTGLKAALGVSTTAPFINVWGVGWGSE